MDSLFCFLIRYNSIPYGYLLIIGT